MDSPLLNVKFVADPEVVPDCSYFMNKVRSSDDAVTAAAVPITFALTPEVAPVST